VSRCGASGSCAILVALARLALTAAAEALALK
jgi:hypothetical protein